MDGYGAIDLDGLIRPAQALAQGLTYRDIRRLVADGAWRPVLRRVYATPSATRDLPALRRRAALVLAGDDGWLYGPSALAEHGVIVGNPWIAHLAMVRTSALPGEPGRLVVHRMPRKPDFVRGGLAMERFEPAVISAFTTLTRESDRQELVCLVIRERRTTIARLRAAADERGRFRGAPAFRFIVALVAMGCHSPIEIDYLLLVERTFGLPTADRQHPMRRGIAARLGSAYGDAYYEELKVLVELDGSGKYDAAKRLDDIRRDLDIATGGDLTIRLSGRQVRQESAQTAAALLAVFAERRCYLSRAA